MSVIQHLLYAPSYGWKDENGQLQKPTLTILLKETAARVNIFRDPRNWISLLSLLIFFLFGFCLFQFFFHYFTWPLFFLFLVYSMFIMSLHATVWLHRFCTHRAFQFSHSIWRFLFQHAVIKTVPEEIYVISHHVHHALSDQPGDPYNASGGFYYCFLAEFNHQRISPTLSRNEFSQALRLLQHTGIGLNRYEQYQQTGSLAVPLYTVLSTLLNWAGWFLLFYLTGGIALSYAFFASALSWFIFVRVFNYTGHGKGKAEHQEGIDFDRRNLSVNQLRPGILAGEWHNNHHLFPRSARTGFLPYQVDLAWYIIYAMYKLGMVSSYLNAKQLFLKKYHRAVQKDSPSFSDD